MLLLGVLSVLQITLIPGFILIHQFRIKTESPVQKFLYIFALSLFTNYSFVAILTILGIYKAVVIYLVIAFEFLWILLLIRTKRIEILKDFGFRETLLKYIALYTNCSLPGKVLIMSSGIIVLFYFSLLISNVGTIFFFVDTVNNIHWNTWAKDFASNILPRQSHHFPQLIPANWSLAYVLTDNTDINFFPKSFMPLFFFSNLLMFLDLAAWKKNYVYLIGLIIYGLFSPIIYSLVFIADGNADLPVSFFAFLTFYIYLKMDKNKFETREQLLFILFAATTAATKLAGLYVFTFGSTISLYGLIRHWKQIKKSDILLMAWFVPFILAICFFWHLIKPEVISSGLSQAEYIGEDYLLIFIKAAKLIYYNLGLPVVAFLLLTILASLFNKECRYVTLIMVLPPLLIWMFKYSIDFRNLSFVVPFIAYVSAFGLLKIIELLRKIPVNLDSDFKEDEKKVFTRRQIIIGSLLSAFCVIICFVINTKIFYSVLVQVYKYIGMYYFQSHRINLLIDYTPYTSVDYYQDVLATMFLIIPVLFLLAVVNLKLKKVLILLTIATIFLNFTFLTEENILQHQKRGVERVDSRNYSFWLNTIVQSSGLDKTIYTNFRPISEEIIPGDLTVLYFEEKDLEKVFEENASQHLIFLKIDLLNDEIKDIIIMRISNNQYEVLFDDGDYLFLRL